MADSSVPITAGSGTNIDTRTESVNGDHRQVVVLGDPVTGANVVTVDANARLNTATSGMSIATPAATALAAAASYTVTATLAGNVTFWLYNTSATTSAGGTYVFEQSPDGTNWAPLQVQRSDTGAVITTVSGVALATNIGIAFDAAMEGVAAARVRCTAATTAGTVYVYGIAGGLAFEPVVSVANAISLAAGTNAIGTVTPPSLTKGTQPTVGFAVQDLKDSGRSVVTAWATAAAGVTSETLFATSWQRAGVLQTATSTTSGIAVSTGKTLRIQNITVTMRLGAAAVGYTRFTLRYVLSGQTISTTSLALWEVEVGPGSSAVVGAVDRFSADFPDGIEIPGGAIWNVSHLSSATTNVETFSVTAFEY